MLGQVCPKPAKISPEPAKGVNATKSARNIDEFWPGLGQVRHHFKHWERFENESGAHEYSAPDVGAKLGSKLPPTPQTSASDACAEGKRRGDGLVEYPRRRNGASAEAARRDDHHRLQGHARGAEQHQHRLPIPERDLQTREEEHEPGRADPPLGTHDMGRDSSRNSIA